MASCSLLVRISTSFARSARSLSSMFSSTSQRDCRACESISRRWTFSCSAAWAASCSSLSVSSCSSSSPTRAALLSLKALWAALFWALRFVGGVSVAGFLPGFGLGGMTHSLVVIEIGAFATGGPGIGEMTDAMDILLTGAAAAGEAGRDFLGWAGWMGGLADVGVDEDGRCWCW